MAWLVRDGEVLASVEQPKSRRDRMKGLLGLDHFQGAMMLDRCRQVHSIGMRFPIDVAFCDAAGTVLRVTTLRPWRVSLPVRKAEFVLEAEAGAFDRWGLSPGDVVEIRW